jgi:tRNA(Arg) A34 adenosine deaminase TadA
VERASIANAAEIRLPDWLAAWPLPPAPVSDVGAMRLAVAIASENVARGNGGPFGACVRDDSGGEIIGFGVNLAMASGNPVLHAETVALSLAGRRLETGGGVALFTSCEPCIMCLGAAHWAGVKRIVSAASKTDAEAAGFSEGAGTRELRAQMRARGVVFADGLLRDESAAVLRAYVDSGGRIYGPRG